MKRIIPFLFFICQIQLNAQNALPEIIENLKLNYQQEKTYTQLTNNSFTPNEFISFSSFVLSGNKISNKSTNLFVELYDDKKNIIANNHFPIHSGKVIGQLKIPAETAEGIYFLRVYTKYMTHFDESLQEIKLVKIIDPKSTNSIVQNTDKKWNFKVKAEGNSFIANHQNKLSVRILNNTNKDWKGFVINKKNNDTILKFNALDENIGTFVIRPEIETTYEVCIKNNGNLQCQLIERPLNKGIKLNVTKINDEIKYYLKGEKIDLKDYKIIGTIDNEPVFVYNVANTTNSISNTLLKTDHNGILQLTVLDPKLNYVTSRMLFLNHQSLVKHRISPKIQWSNIPKEQNTISFPKKDEKINYSILIKDDESIQDENIISSIWLTSYLKNQLNNPAQYFNSNSNYDAIDGILISEDWNRFDWKKVLQKINPILLYKPETFLTYKGRLYTQNGPLINEKVNLILSNKKGQNDIINVHTNQQGEFTLDHIYIEDSATVNVHSNSKKNIRLNMQKVDFKSPYKGQFFQNVYVIKTLDSIEIKDKNDQIQEILNNDIQYNQQVIKLKEALIVGYTKSKKEILNESLSTGQFKNMMFEQIIDFVNEQQTLEGFTDRKLWFRGIIAGADIKKVSKSKVDIDPFIKTNDDTQKPQISDETELYLTIRGTRVKFYLDEMPIDDDYAYSIPVIDIAMIKVIKDIGTLQSSIVIYTKRKNYNLINQPSTFATKIIGYPVVENKYLYEEYDKTYLKMTKDLRKIIYWNPEINVEKNTNHIFNFNNNDFPKQYSIEIIGISEDGNILYN